MKKAILLLIGFAAFISYRHQTRNESGFAEINGKKLYYEVAGSGEPLVVVYGNFADCPRGFQF